jgi:hypothetical protein
MVLKLKLTPKFNFFKLKFKNKISVISKIKLKIFIITRFFTCFILYLHYLISLHQLDLT